MDKVTVKDVVKFVAGTATGVGTSYIVAQVIKNTVVPHQSIFMRVATGVSAAVIGTVAARYVSDQTERIVDELDESLKKQILGQN